MADRISRSLDVPIPVPQQPSPNLAETLNQADVNAFDLIDAGGVLLFFALAVLLPAAGYLCMVLDIRAYLRSLKRMLVPLSGGQTMRSVPVWARKETPSCLHTFFLTLPCTEEQLTEAYRRKVKDIHPDHGGDQEEFLRVQRQFEEALRLVREIPQPTPESPKA